eukprot:6184737-Pleurochrysis_carterae.AAC.5
MMRILSHAGANRLHHEDIRAMHPCDTAVCQHSVLCAFVRCSLPDGAGEYANCALIATARYVNYARARRTSG